MAPFEPGELFSHAQFMRVIYFVGKRTPGVIFGYDFPNIAKTPFAETLCEAHPHESRAVSMLPSCVNRVRADEYSSAKDALAAKSGCSAF